MKCKQKIERIEESKQLKRIKCENERHKTVYPSAALAIPSINEIT